MSGEDLLRHEVVMKVMCHFRLDKREIAGRHGLQRYPSFVIEIGETILVLDADVAGDIVVARAC